MADDSILKYSDIIGADDTFEVIFANLERLRGELESLAKDTQKAASIINPNDDKAIEELTAKVKQLEAALSSLNKVQSRASSTKKKVNQLTQDELIQREKQKIANREAVQEAKQLAIIQRSQAGSIEALRAQLSLTTLQWKKLSANERQNGVEGRKLVAQKLKLTNQLKKLEKQTGDNRRNVGNYTKSLGRLGKVAAGIFIGRNLVSGITRIGNAFGRIIENNKETNESIKGISRSFESFKTAASNVGVKILEFLAKPIEIVIGGLTSLFNLFSDPEPFKEFKTTSEELKKETEKLNKELIKEQAAAEQLFTTIKDVNTSTEDRKIAIEKLNKQYGKYIPNLLTEKSTLNEIEEAQKLVNVQLSRAFALRLEQATTQDILTNKITNTFDAFENFQKQNKNITADQKVAFFELVEGLAAGNKEYLLAIDYLKAISGFQFQYGNELKATNPELFKFVKELRNASKVTPEQAEFIEQIAEQTRLYNKDLQSSQQVISDLNKKINDNTFRTQAQVDAIIKASNETNKETEENKKNTKSISDNVNAREKLIEKLEQQTEKLKEAREKGDAKAEEDEQTKLIRLEQIRFNTAEKARLKTLQDLQKVQQEQRKKLIDAGFKEDSEQIKMLDEKQKKETEEAQEESFRVQEQNLLFHFEELARIEKEGNAKLLKEQDEKLKKEQEAEEKAQEKARKKAKEDFEKRIKQTITEVTETAEKIVDIFVKAQQKQVELSQLAVEEQANAVEIQRERAEKGLSNTLKFEQEQLAKREAERLRAEKKAEQAAKLQTLFNLVSAYAKSGDTNALQRGLVDFALLEALGAGLEAGFEEGGYTGDNGKKQVAGVVHGQEYVVRAEDTKRFGLVGKSGKQFGEAMSDYFAYSPLLYNPYNEQREQFIRGNYQKDNSNKLYEEVRAMRQAFENIKSNDYDMVEMTDNFVKIAHKVTNKRMTTINKTRKRL